MSTSTLTGDEWKPVRLIDLELGEPLAAQLHEPGVGEYGEVSALVRLHGRCLGVVALPAHAGPSEVVRPLWEAVGGAVRKHLVDDGLVEVVDRLSEDGVPPLDEPRCIARRRALLQAAPPVTVLVATHDRTADLAVCLESLLAQDYPGNYHIVVVDSAPSSSETEEYLWRFGSGGRVRYLRAERPGLAVAHNTALPAVTGEILAVTDDDVVVDRQWLSAIVECFRQFPGTGCVTGLILPFELDTPGQMLVEQYGGFARGFERRVVSLQDPPVDPLFPYSAGRLGSGANMAFDAAGLRALGGFDPALGAGTRARGGDDLAAFVQVLLAGHRLVYQPDAVVRHKHRRDYGGLRSMTIAYGVGLGAYLTSVVASRPLLLWDLAGKAPAAVSYLLRSDSAKNSGKGAVYPHELTRVERLGMLRGPFAYAASRWRAR